MIIDKDFVQISEKSHFYLNYAAVKKQAAKLKVPHTRIAKILDIQKYTLSAYMNTRFFMSNGEERWEQTIANRMMEEFGPAAIRDMYNYFHIINVPMAEYEKFTKYLLYVVATGKIYDKQNSNIYYTQRGKEISEDLFISLLAIAELRKITVDSIARVKNVAKVVNEEYNDAFNTMVGYFFDIAGFPVHGKYMVDHVEQESITVKDITSNNKGSENTEIVLKTINPNWYQDHFSTIIEKHKNKIASACDFDYRETYNKTIATHIIETVSEKYIERVLDSYNTQIQKNNETDKDTLLFVIKEDIRRSLINDCFSGKELEVLKHSEYDYKVMYNKILTSDILNSLSFSIIKDIQNLYVEKTKQEFPIENGDIEKIINKKTTHTINGFNAKDLLEERPLGDYEFYYTISEQPYNISVATKHILNRKYRRCLFGYIAKTLSDEDIMYYLRILLFARGFNEKIKQIEILEAVAEEKAQYEDNIGQPFERNKVFHLASELHCIPQYIIGTSDRPDWAYGVVDKTLNPLHPPVWFFEKEAAEKAGDRLEDILLADAKEVVKMFETLSKTNRNKLLDYMREKYQQIYMNSDEYKENIKSSKEALEKVKNKAKNKQNQKNSAE